MKNNEWINWINDQIDDMYNEDSFDNVGFNRVFKTTEDDRDIAVHILKKLKSFLEKDDE